MTLMIFEMFWPASLISFMAVTISCILALPPSAAFLVWPANWLAWVAFSAFSLVCEAISVMELVISSSDAACSVAP